MSGRFGFAFEDGTNRYRKIEEWRIDCMAIRKKHRADGDEEIFFNEQRKRANEAKKRERI